MNETTSSSPIRGRRLGALVLGVGIVMVGLTQWLVPVGGPPLYDGVTTVAPYLWLKPPAGASGGAQGSTGTVGIEGGKNRLIAIATPELQPQAQLFATPGAFSLPAGTSSLKVSVEPTLPQTLPTDGHIEGNVYRISVTNQDGTPLVAPASAEVTVGLRGPYTTANQVIAVDDAQGWHKLKTEDAGFAASYLAVTTGGGDYAMVAPGPGGPYPTATPAAGAASTGPGGSAGTAGSSAPSAEPLPSIGEIGGSPASSAGPSSVLGSIGPVGSTGPGASSADSGASGSANGSSGLPIVPLAVVIVLALAGVGLVLWSRGRRGPPPTGPRYQGAHRR
ncbi:MAG: hypothetical protein ACRDGQ_02730 [Candidatus Limnocylindrales bacterium]